MIADVVEKAITAERPKSAYVAPTAARIMLQIAKLIGNDAFTRGFLKLPRKM